MGRARSKRALVCGAGGFIGTHIVQCLVAEGYWVRGVDLHKPLFSTTHADDFVLGDLCDLEFFSALLDDHYDEIYQFAANMGGAGFIFLKQNETDIMQNSVQINLNLLRAIKGRAVGRVFWSSSACVYPIFNQTDPDHPNCEETSAYPALPDSEYGWEKLFSERLYLAFARNSGIPVRIARYHNIFGPLGAWQGGREKAPAAICRKVAKAKNGDIIEIWGDGRQTRSFLYIDECADGTMRLMRSPFGAPVNIGSEEMISISQLVALTSDIAGKRLEVRYIDGPQGVRGRTSDNRLIKRVLGWKPSRPLREGLERTYAWIEEQVLMERA
jgi:GDP-D-mannose 3', 5'-epimerase